MKKKNHHHRKKRRNDAAGGTALAARSRARNRAPRLPRANAPPPWQTMVAAVAGGGVSAAVGGLVVNQRILSPEAVGFGLMLGGGATAYYGSGNTRIVGTSMAAAGAGQLALAVMARQALKGKTLADGGAHANAPPAPSVPRPPSPPPAVPPPRTSATGGGLVADLFRDAAMDLDMIDDEWRYGVRDHRDAAEPHVIELDEAA